MHLQTEPYLRVNIRYVVLQSRTPSCGGATFSVNVVLNADRYTFKRAGQAITVSLVCFHCCLPSLLGVLRCEIVEMFDLGTSFESFIDQLCARELP